MIGHTCGIACWTARDDTCHCSCGGANHGCMRGSGVAPTRSRRIQGQFYELHSVHGGFGELNTARERKELPPEYVRTTATLHEVSVWPELTRWRGQSAVDRIMHPPILLWVRTTRYK